MEKLRIFLACLFIFGFSFSLQGQGGGRFVQDVRVRGEQRIPATSILSQIKTKPGLIATRESLDEDIRRLFSLGQFRDIQVDEEAGPHGLIITFIVSEKPVINKIIIEGNHKVKENTIREAITLPLYQPLNEKKLSESIEAIRKIYDKKNFYLIDIDHDLRTTQAGDHEFVFQIHERAPAQIREVQFVGNAVFSDDELRGIVKTKKKAMFSFLTGSGKFKEEDLKQDVLRLTFHYLKNGYLKVMVDEPQIFLTKDKRYFFVTFHVHEGDRYRINKLDMAGDILTTKEQLLKDLLTKPGQIYNREFIEKDMQSLTKLYGNQGYAFVHIQPQTETNEADKTADITYQIEKGNRIYIETINISGNTVTRDKVIRREMRIMEGDVYNETEVEKSRERLMALGYFKDVNFATPRGNRDDTLKLNITVDEKPTGSFSVGAGFSTTEDFILSGSISKQNFFGRGWNGEVSAELSHLRQQFLFNMTDPYFFDTQWILGMSAFKTVFRFENFDRDSYGGSFSVGHRFFDNASMSMGYEAEQVSALDFSSIVPVRFTQNSGGLTSLVNLTINRDTRDNRVYATKGMFNSAKLEVSDHHIGADNNFFRATGKTQFYQPIIKKLVFKTYGRVGYIKSLDDTLIPLFERFFLGGVNTLRGYYPQSIGPQEPVVTSTGTQNFVYGGNKMIVFNNELEFPIFDPAGLRAVAFFDAGNTFAEEEDIALQDLRLDYGFGVRWISPLGPLRFEWGFPIQRQPGEQKTVFNFTIGQFF
ncbi:MAG: outer membrane protein assembly factor BamA [Deltaproteobacteria bacterium]|nr:outer membrane protein assembly factor BamA [Deltaproteobacteria bacterium]